MSYPVLSDAANLVAWARNLIKSLNQREAQLSTLTNLSTYASDTAAGAAGITSGQFYRTSDGSGGFYVKVKS